MTWTVDASGTQTATINTEHVLDTPTTPNATFVLKVDTSAMVNGDVLELRVYDVVLASGAVVQEWKGTYSNIQVNGAKQSPFVAINQAGAKFTLKQIAGTGRAFPWSVLKQ